MIAIHAEKSPDEDFPMEINFGVGDWGKLFRNDPINTVTVTDWSDNPLVVPTISGPDKDDLIVQFRVSGGANNATYYLKVQAVSLTNAYKGEAFIILDVKKPSTT